MEFEKLVNLKLNNFNIETPKKEFVIPKPAGESEQEYISKCMHAIGNEYPQEQALAICYAQLEK
jgi:hypothetical protein